MNVVRDNGAPSVSTLDLPNHLLIYSFEPGSHYITQADLKGMVFLSASPKGCDYRHRLPYLPSTRFLILLSGFICYSYNLGK